MTTEEMTRSVRITHGIKNKIQLLEKGTQVIDYIREQAASYSSEMDRDRGFCVVNLSQALQVVDRWKALFPNIRPYFALKCNYDPELVKLFISQGCGLDCASQIEIELGLSLGAGINDIIYHHPYKPLEHLRYAVSKGIDLTVVDSIEETQKIRKHHPDAKVLIRLRSYNPETSKYAMGWKFGCLLETAYEILKYAKNEGVNVVGTCFHVGIGTSSSESFCKSLLDSKQVFKYAESFGYKLTVLNIGGGFPGKPEELTASFAEKVNEIIKQNFEEYPDLKVIAEPGRYFATSSFTIAMRIMGKGSYYEDDSKDKSAQIKHFKYYFSDGKFGVFNKREYFEPLEPKPIEAFDNSSPTYPSTLYGPALTDYDTICELEVPELQLGQWFYFENSGAYSLNIHTGFNGFTKPDMLYVLQESDKDRYTPQYHTGPPQY